MLTVGTYSLFITEMFSTIVLIYMCFYCSLASMFCCHEVFHYAFIIFSGKFKINFLLMMTIKIKDGDTTLKRSLIYNLIAQTMEKKKYCGIRIHL